MSESKTSGSKTSTAKFLEDAVKLFSPAQIAKMRSNGLAIIEGKREGSYLFDIEDKRYLDCICSKGIFNLGRLNKEVITEFKKAMHETEQGNFPMISIEKAALAHALADFVPGDLECSLFSVVRGETVEFACKLARGYTGRSEIITIENSWFGQTGFALSLSQRSDKQDFAPLMPEIKIIPFSDDIQILEDNISKNTAAVIIEPIQAENHCKVIGQKYLSELRQICNKMGAVLIFDETQSGLGRSGSKFAFMSSEIEPDVLIIGEALGAGIFPIAATMFTQKLNAFMNEHPLIHLSTFGGSDLACRVAIKALEVYERDSVWDNAKLMGSKLQKGLSSIASSSDGLILDVAGSGLLVSIEFLSEQDAMSFCRIASNNGLLVSVGDVAKSSVIFRPSLLISDVEIDEVLAIVKTSIKELSDSL